MSVFLDLAATGTEHIGTLEFWRYALMYMQQDQGNTTSQCITTFDDWTELVQDLLASIVDDTEYIAGLIAKGQGSGTNVGFIIDKGQSYLDAFIYSVNVFNYCDLDYYLMAIGKSVGSASGASNQLINLLYRFFSSEDSLNYFEMSVALTPGDSDTQVVGKCVGKFLSKFLMVEVPDTAATPSYQQVGSLM